MGNRTSSERPRYLLKIYRKEIKHHTPLEVLQKFYDCTYYSDRDIYYTNLDLMKILQDVITCSSSINLTLQFLGPYWKDINFLLLDDLLSCIPSSKDKIVLLKIWKMGQKRVDLETLDNILGMLDHFSRNDKVEATILLLELAGHTISLNRESWRKFLVLTKSRQGCLNLLNTLSGKIWHCGPFPPGQIPLEFLVDFCSLTPTSKRIIRLYSSHISSFAVEILKMSSIIDKYRIFQSMFPCLKVESAIPILKLFRQLKEKLLILMCYEKKYKRKELKDVYKYFRGQYHSDEMFRELVCHHREIREKDIRLISRILGRKFIPKIKLSSEPDNLLCTVCQDQKRNMIFLPCGHCCCCEKCSVKLKRKCPICRMAIKHIQPIYFS